MVSPDSESGAHCFIKSMQLSRLFGDPEFYRAFVSACAKFFQRDRWQLQRYHAEDEGKSPTVDLYDSRGES